MQQQHLATGVVAAAGTGYRRSTVALPAQDMNEEHARIEICRVGRCLHQQGLVPGSSGAISARIADGFLITPGDASLGFLRPPDIAKADLDGQQVNGQPVGKDLALHRRIYRDNERIGEPVRCVIHAASPHCMALALQTTGPELLPPLTPALVMKVGHVPIVPYRRPRDGQVAEAVTALITRYGARETPLRALMLCRLGPLAWHDTPAQALAVLEELETAAHIWQMTGGNAEPLDADALGELRAAFGTRW